MLVALWLAVGSALGAPTARAAPPPVPEGSMIQASFAPLPGWLALSVAPRASRVLPWTPDHPHATVVLLDPVGWDALDEGTAFYGLTSKGPVNLAYSELSSVPYGCDDAPTQMVAWTGPVDLDEEVVWVSERAGGERIPVVAAPPSASERHYVAGDVEVVVEATGSFAGKIRVLERGKPAWAEAWEKGELDGVDRPPVDLAADWDNAVPAPVGLFVLPDGERVLVLRTVGYEGVTFTALVERGKKWESAGSRYLHLCSL